MNKIHKQRIYLLTLCVLGVSIAIGMILYALQQNINAFMTPAQLKTTSINSDYQLRLGGMVRPNSIKRTPHNLNVEFKVTDFKQDIVVKYNGILPDLFREGKGVIAEGRLDKNGIFIASSIFAKHDENYMPKNVYEAMRKKP